MLPGEVAGHAAAPGVGWQRRQHRTEWAAWEPSHDDGPEMIHWQSWKGRSQPSHAQVDTNSSDATAFLNSPTFLGEIYPFPLWYQALIISFESSIRQINCWHSVTKPRCSDFCMLLVINSLVCLWTSAFLVALLSCVDTVLVDFRSGFMLITEHLLIR